ncbi:MAG: beta strand repeat-containing protein, partial [Shewanella sp.]
MAPTSGAGAVMGLLAEPGAISITPNGADQAVMFNYDGATVIAGALDARILSADGSEFRMVSMEVDTGAGLGTSPNLTVTGYRDNVSVTSDTINTGSSDSSGSVTYTKNGVGGGFGGTLTFNSTWNYVDEIRFTGTNTIVVVDDLDFEAGIPPLPTVTDARISISGASGTAGAYKIGDTVTATWNNTAGGDNNAGITGVTVDFSQFGGGASVTASNSSGTWTAIYTITAGAIDTTNRNVSVTATNSSGSTTTADTTNATVDNIAPTVTDANISLSGASGTGGAYIIGDTVTATWNNTAGGDNNSDTISSVSVDFSAFGGGGAVIASNSSGTWTATYTITAGAIDTTNLNVSVTAIDNAGNTTTRADSTNATLDNDAPAVSSIAVSGSPASSDTSMAFTVTFDESVINISTDDFTLVATGSATGTIASVSASSGSSITVNIASISGNGTIKVNLNSSTNIVDDAGNGISAYSSGSTHTVAIPTAPDAPTIGAATAGDGQVSVAFTAPSNNGGSAITGYTVTSSPDGITAGGNGFTSSPITVTGLTNGTAYTFTVTATNAIGTSAASATSGSATPMADQTITFANPGAQNFGTSPTLSATSTSGLTVSFSSSTTGVCTITSGGALTFVTAGSCTIDADQAGDGSTHAATTVSRTFTVNAVVPGGPTIGTATAGDTQASISFTAPASIGGAAITGYTVTANPGGATGTGAGSPITVTGLTNGVSYTFTVTATNSAGTGSASAASNSITPASPQTITFANPGMQSFGTSPMLTATADSGLTVAFTSSTTSVCTVNSTTLTFVTAGSCTINADQPGNSAYLPASQVSRTFTVNPALPGAPTSVAAIAGDTQASVSFTDPVNTGGTSITGYTVSVSPPDVLPVNGVGSPIVVNGLTNGQAYTFTVRADNAAGTGPASVVSNSITPKASQTITFNNPGAQNFGATPTFSAT